MKHFLLLSLLFIGLTSFAQMGINASGTAPAASAMLDVSATNKGFLPPRLTITQRSNIASPTAGLEVYCTDCTPAGPYSYNGTTWLKMFDYQTASGPCVQYTVGQAAQGGIVIWVDDSGQHGIVAAQSDIFVGTGLDSDGIPYISSNSTGVSSFIAIPIL